MLAYCSSASAIRPTAAGLAANSVPSCRRCCCRCEKAGLVCGAAPHAEVAPAAGCGCWVQLAAWGPAGARSSAGWPFSAPAFSLDSLAVDDSTGASKTTGPEGANAGVGTACGCAAAAAVWRPVSFTHADLQHPAVVAGAPGPSPAALMPTCGCTEVAAAGAAAAAEALRFAAASLVTRSAAAVFAGPDPAAVFPGAAANSCRLLAALVWGSPDCTLATACPGAPPPALLLLVADTPPAALRCCCRRALAATSALARPALPAAAATAGAEPPAGCCVCQSTATGACHAALEMLGLLAGAVAAEPHEAPACECYVTAYHLLHKAVSSQHELGRTHGSTNRPCCQGLQIPMSRSFSLRTAVWPCLGCSQGSCQPLRATCNCSTSRCILKMQTPCSLC